MAPQTQLSWTDPLSLLSYCSENTVALLLSGVDAGFTGRYSYLCLGEQQKKSGSDLFSLRDAIHGSGAWCEHFWVGYLGYGLKNQLEKLPQDAPSIIVAPDYCFIQPKTIYRFDHHAKIVEYIGEHSLAGDWGKPAPPTHIPGISRLQSNMTGNAYLEKVSTIIESIKAGALYQANLTRKFFGEFTSAPDGPGIFRALCHHNPAAYSAYLRMDGLEIISSSPEQFLSITSDGIMKSRPIKGTIARGNTPTEDAMQKQVLLTSAKDKAENLMIVDLMRHDFSRVCEPGSVSVEGMFDLSTHAHIHHLSSTISGKMKPGITALDAALACFPPGSMTGAPKIRAMHTCSMLEPNARGIYSGALGWFGGDGSAALSVIIRTLIVQGKRFEFQVGGGIVADSVPEKELEETLTKAKGIAGTLGISLQELKNL